MRLQGCAKRSASRCSAGSGSQWWREAIAAIYAGGPPRRHTVVEPLAATIRERDLPRAYFDRLIEAREGDLDEAPPATLAALEDYAEGSSSQLLYWRWRRSDARCAGGEAGRHVGIAYALAGLLRAMPYWTAMGRPIVPLDIAARRRSRTRGVPRRGARRRCATPLPRSPPRRGTICGRRGRCARDPRPALPALLPAGIARRFLRRLERAGFDPFAQALAPLDPLQSWRLAIAALRRRF